MKPGLGASAGFLRTHRGWLARGADAHVPAPLTRTFPSDALVTALVDLYVDPMVNVGGLSPLRVQRVECIERWRRETIKRLASED